MRVSLIRLSILLACLGLASQALAQSTNLNTFSKSDTISSNGDYVEMTTATIGGLGGGFGSVKVQTKDSYSGTWEVQCSVDGSLAGYDTGSELKITPTDGTSVAYSVTDTVAIYDIGNASGCQSIRVIATAGFAASDVTVAITATQSGGSSGGGGGGGAGTSDTTEATQLLVLAELTTSDASLADIAIDTNDAAGSLTNIEEDIDYIRTNLSVDSDNDVLAATKGPQQICYSQDFDTGAFPGVVSAETDAVRVACSLYGVQYMMLVSESGAVDIGTGLLTAAQLSDDVVFADEAAFTYTTSKATAIAGVAESTTDAVADGVVATLITDTARRLVVTPTPSTYGGLSIYRSIDLDEGTGEVIKNGPGQLYSLWVTNTATSTRFIKIYNATSCTIGTGTPVITIGIPGNTSDDVAGQLTGGGMGIEFTTGICFGAVTGVADADTGAPGANDIVANALYK